LNSFDSALYIASAAGTAVVKPDFFQVFKRQSFGDAQVSKITSAASKDHCSSVNETSPMSAMFGIHL
jgi:hypothetical protein